MLWSILTGAMIGLIASSLTDRENRVGCIGRVLVGLLGAWVGQALFGNWGPIVADMAVIPSILGAILLLVLFTDRD
ncbi:GlsB/YeaQ/YmgE family stress response membrane protein [Streptococcus sp. DD13]|uniref:GlsB/YeaQ/YmgE family stress response membrane protein n=1 Tax=Streptococcus sp. DD13 TaxID=1777881 RepID=UPI00079530B4|nr:GlsB/YeaQ/YmgE family stress response membrane protein [Streptococcus sp. DD13]KXT77570.1 hypothetical protein STRDD13_01441 [Streptococcus sp. DD13]